MGLIMDETSAGNPPSDLDQYTVKSHTPPGGAIVAKGEHINVRVYDRYMVAVPNLIKPPLSQIKAAEVIKKAKLKPAIEDRDQKEERIEAHIRAVLEKFSAIEMIDIHLPTTDGRTIIMSWHTQPEPELQILLKQLRLSFPKQSSPRVATNADMAEQNVVKTF